MDKPLLLDGPMGTEIDRRGGDTSIPLWSARALIDNSKMVEQIHLDYINSGVDIITTNTFRTQEYTIKKAGIHTHTAKDLTQKAVNLGKRAIEESEKILKLAGSIAPIEDCYSPHLVPRNDVLSKEHNQMAKWLYEAGIDLFLVETMNTIREAKIAVNATLKYDLPVYLSFTADINGKILDGSSWNNVIDIFEENVELILINCTSVEGTQSAIKELNELKFENWGSYPNFGTVNASTGWTSIEITEEYLHEIKNWLQLNPKLIGTCCGATPTESRIISEMIS